MDNMHVVILTPYKRLYDFSNVSDLCFPTAENGMVGILPGHAPMMAAIGTGVVSCTSIDNSVKVFVVAGGVADVTGEKVTILVDVGENADEIDIERAQKSLERAEGRMTIKEENVDILRAEEARQRALARIEAVRIRASACGSPIKDNVDSESDHKA